MHHASDRSAPTTQPKVPIAAINLKKLFKETYFHLKGHTCLESGPFRDALLIFHKPWIATNERGRPSTFCLVHMSWSTNETSVRQSLLVSRRPVVRNAEITQINGTVAACRKVWQPCYTLNSLYLFLFLRLLQAFWFSFNENLRTHSSSLFWIIKLMASTWTDCSHLHNKDSSIIRLFNKTP